MISVVGCARKTIEAPVVVETIDKSAEMPIDAVADVVEEVKKQAVANSIITVTEIHIGLGKKADLSTEGFKICFEALSKADSIELANKHVAPHRSK